MIKTVLTIAGSDSCCGAGIQADIKTISSLGGYGVSAITALTAQNSKGVQNVLGIPADFVGNQIDSLASDFDISAVKSGMLFDVSIVHVVAERMKYYGFKYFVVDPIIVSKNGRNLLTENAIKEVVSKLRQVAYLITPNIPEAEILAGGKISNLEDIKAAAIRINELGFANVLIKGGHAVADQSSNIKRKAMDVLFDGERFEFFEHEFITDNIVHGTGCVFSAAITTELAKGNSLADSINNAKNFVSRSIANSINLGQGYGLFVL